MCKKGTIEKKLGTRGTSLGYSHNRVTMHNPYEIATITNTNWNILRSHTSAHYLCRYT